MDELAMDEEEFPLGTDPEHFIAMTQEVIDELSKASLASTTRIECMKLILQ
jgi:hypothetical protein